jgi:hypothetical protein
VCPDLQSVLGQAGTLYRSFRADAGGGMLAGMQELARLTPAVGRGGGGGGGRDDVDLDDFFSVSEGTGTDLDLNLEDFEHLGGADSDRSSCSGSPQHWALGRGQAQQTAGQEKARRRGSREEELAGVPSMSLPVAAGAWPNEDAHAWVVGAVFHHAAPAPSPFAQPAQQQVATAEAPARGPGSIQQGAGLADVSTAASALLDQRPVDLVLLLMQLCPAPHSLAHSRSPSPAMHQASSQMPSLELAGVRGPPFYARHASHASLPQVSQLGSANSLQLNADTEHSPRQEAAPQVLSLHMVWPGPAVVQGQGRFEDAAATGSVGQSTDKLRAHVTCHPVQLLASASYWDLATHGLLGTVEQIQLACQPLLGPSPGHTAAGGHSTGATEGAGAAPNGMSDVLPAFLELVDASIEDLVAHCYFPQPASLALPEEGVGQQLSGSQEPDTFAEHVPAAGASTGLHSVDLEGMAQQGLQGSPAIRHINSECASIQISQLQASALNSHDGRLQLLSCEVPATTASAGQLTVQVEAHSIGFAKPATTLLPSRVTHDAVNVTPLLHIGHTCVTLLPEAVQQGSGSYSSEAWQQQHPTAEAAPLLGLHVGDISVYASKQALGAAMRVLVVLKDAQAAAEEREAERLRFASRGSSASSLQGSLGDDQQLFSPFSGYEGGVNMAGVTSSGPRGPSSGRLPWHQPGRPAGSSLHGASDAGSSYRLVMGSTNAAGGQSGSRPGAQTQGYTSEGQGYLPAGPANNLPVGRYMHGVWCCSPLLPPLPSWFALSTSLSAEHMYLQA